MPDERALVAHRPVACVSAHPLDLPRGGPPGGPAGAPRGFFPNDYAAIGVLEGVPPPTPLYSTSFSLFRFAVGDPRVMQKDIAKGIYPWWTLPELKMTFYRPLASALLWLAHSLYGVRPLPWLAQSLLWYLALVAVFGVLMRRLLPGAVGGLALLLFALDDTHAIPVSTIVDNNPVVATFGALLGLLFHVAWREQGRRRSTSARPSSPSHCFIVSRLAQSSREESGSR